MTDHEALHYACQTVRHHEILYVYVSCEKPEYYAIKQVLFIGHFNLDLHGMFSCKKWGVHAVVIYF